MIFLGLLETSIASTFSFSLFDVFNDGTSGLLEMLP